MKSNLEMMTLKVDQPLTETAQAKFSCRMYSEKFPKVDDLVMVNVRQITEVGAYVQLLEYNNIEGMISLSELSRRRINSIKKLIRVDTNIVVVVLRVDKEKGYIDLSKRVSAEDIQKHNVKYNKSKLVHSIMRHVAESLDLDLQDLYTRIGWPLYTKYGHAIDAFKLAIDTPLSSPFEDLNFHSEKTKAEFITNIKHRLAPQVIKICADIECSCFGNEGVDAIKTALKAGEDCSTAEIPIKIRLVAPPLYVMVTHSIDKTLGITTLEKAILAIEASIKSTNCTLTIKNRPRAVSENDDLEFGT